MADKTNTYNMIAALRRETAKNAVSPELLGSILKSIVDLIDGTVDNATLDTGSGNSSHSNTFGGLVEDDTYTPIIISDLDVQLEQGASRTLTMNRAADEVLLSAYDDSIVNVIVADGTLTVVALQEDGNTEFSISDENGSVTVRVTVGEAAVPDLPLSEVEKLLLDKQDRVVEVREENLAADYLHGCGLMLERNDVASPLVAVQSGDAGELSQGIYLEAGYTVRAYRQTDVEAYSAIAIALIYGEEMEAGQIGATMESVDEGDLEFVVPFSGHYAFSGLQEIDHLTKEVPVTVEEVLAMKQDKVNGKGLSTNDYTTEEKTKLLNLPTSSTLNAKLKAIPNDVSRTQTDATFVHSESGVLTTLFHLRQATAQLAGLMTSSDKAKLDGLPLMAGTGASSMRTNSSNTASGEYSVAIGENNVATAKGAVAVGKNNGARQEYAYCFGENNYTIGWDSFLVGTSNGVYRHMGMAIGRQNTSYAWAGICLGLGNKTKDGNDGEVAVGRWNETKAGLVFSIGCGTSDSDRKNALEIYDDGTVLFPQAAAEEGEYLTLNIN